MAEQSGGSGRNMDYYVDMTQFLGGGYEGRDKIITGALGPDGGIMNAATAPFYVYYDPAGKIVEDDKVFPWYDWTSDDLWGLFGMFLAPFTGFALGVSDKGRASVRADNIIKQAENNAAIVAAVAEMTYKVDNEALAKQAGKAKKEKLVEYLKGYGEKINPKEAMLKLAELEEYEAAAGMFDKAAAYIGTENEIIIKALDKENKELKFGYALKDSILEYFEHNPNSIEVKGGCDIYAKKVEDPEGDTVSVEYGRGGECPYLTDKMAKESKYITDIETDGA